MNLPVAIKYKDAIYLCYKLVDDRYHLIDSNGKKYSGTPVFELTKMQIVKSDFETRDFNNHKYVQTKQGVYSMTTGNKVGMKEILDLLEGESI